MLQMRAIEATLFDADTEDESDSRCCGCGSAYAERRQAFRPPGVGSTRFYGDETDQWIQCPSVVNGFPCETACVCVDCEASGKFGICCLCSKAEMMTEDHCYDCYFWLQNLFEEKYKRAVRMREVLLGGKQDISDQRLENALQRQANTLVPVDPVDSLEYHLCARECTRQVLLTKLDDAMFSAVKDDAFVVPSWWGYTNRYARRVCACCYAPFEEVKRVNNQDICVQCHLEMVVAESQRFLSQPLGELYA